MREYDETALINFVSSRYATLRLRTQCSEEDVAAVVVAVFDETKKFHFIHGNTYYHAYSSIQSENQG